MQGALLTFQRELDQLRSYLAVTDQVIGFGMIRTTPSWPAEAAGLVGVIRASGLPVFQTSFDGALLRLAADFEQLISRMTSEFLALVPGHIARYEQLPEKLQSWNERSTGRVLDRRGRHAALDARRLIGNLHNCMQGAQPYILNAEAILIIERNLTARELGEFMQRLGIESFWEKMSQDGGLQRWAGATDSTHTQSSIQAKLDEFITDRNAVAHRASGASSVGPSVVAAYIQYFDALGPALLSLFQQYLAGMSSRSAAP